MWMRFVELFLLLLPELEILDAHFKLCCVIQSLPTCKIIQAYQTLLNIVTKAPRCKIELYICSKLLYLKRTKLIFLNTLIQFFLQKTIQWKHRLKTLSACPKQVAHSPKNASTKITHVVNSILINDSTIKHQRPYPLIKYLN